MLELARRFFGRFRLNLIVGPACKLVEVCFDLMTPILVARMIDRGVAAHDLSAVVSYGCLLGVFALVGIGFALVCQKMASRASQGIGTDVRSALYRHINRLSYAELDRFGTPSLITRLTNDVNQVQLAVALAIRQLVRWPFLAVGSVVAALLIDVQLGLIFLVSAPIIAGVFWFVMARCVPCYRKLQEKLDRIGLLTRQGLSGVRVIRAFAREGRERKLVGAAADDQAATAIAVGKLSAVLNPVTFLVMNLSICCILWVGGWKVEVGGLTQGEVTAFVNYMTQTLLSIVYVANLVVVFTKAGASAARINEVLDCAPSIVDGPGALGHPSPAAAPAIELDHVTFSYPGSPAAALDDVSLRLGQGQTLGIIGGTGSGKSTLVNLLPRLYDVTGGRLSLFGADVRTWKLPELRAAIGLVPQMASLVSGTIRSNLCWRDEGAADRELWRALEIAQAADFVRAKPEGIDSPVEAGGKNFSGGQRQRLTIARALVGAPRLLVLDDSSSALDFKTDAALRRAIKAEAFERAAASDPLTTVIVSQRVSTVRSSDLILVLQHGRPVGLGTHEGLLAACEAYREIVQSQESSGGAPAREGGAA